MIDDIYQHEDLLEIANCRSKGKLRKWMVDNGIPIKTDSKGMYIASRKLIQSILGYDDPKQQEKEVRLNLDA